MDKRIDLFHLLNQENKLETILCYPAKENVNDPYEQTTDTVYLNPLPVKALVRQLSQEAIRWKYYGNVPMVSIEIIAELKTESLFKTADKIEYKGQFYKTIQDDSKNFLITKRSDYIVVILGLKTTND
jgi:hypothetical protein